MPNDDEALLRRWFEEVWNKGRAEAIDEMLAADAIIHGLGDELRGPAGFKPFHTAFRDAFPDIHLQVHEVLAEGGMVAVRWSGAGTHRGDGLGLAATGNAVRFEGMTFARVERGLIVEGWNVFDQLSLLRQIGAVDLPAT